MCPLSSGPEGPARDEVLNVDNVDNTSWIDEIKEDHFPPMNGPQSQVLALAGDPNATVSKFEVRSAASLAGELGTTAFVGLEATCLETGKQTGDIEHLIYGFTNATRGRLVYRVSGFLDSRAGGDITYLRSPSRSVHPHRTLRHIGLGYASTQSRCLVRGLSAAGFSGYII